MSSGSLDSLHLVVYFTSLYHIEGLHTSSGSSRDMSVDTISCPNSDRYWIVSLRTRQYWIASETHVSSVASIVSF